jgi:hypothetical protein
MNKLLILCFGALAACLFINPVRAEELVAIQGTKARLAQPAGFTIAKQFPGFAQEENMSSVMVTEIPAPYGQFAASLTKEAMAPKGMSLISSEEVKFGDAPGTLIHLRQVANEIPFLKWMGLTGSAAETVMVTATFPQSLADTHSAPLKAAVLSTRWDAGAQVDPLAGLNFSIEEQPDLKIAKRISNMLMLTPNGELPKPDSPKTLLVVATSLSNVEIPDVAEFARTRLQGTANVLPPEVVSQKEVTVDGMAGSFIVSRTAWKGQPEEAATLFQWLFPDGKGYYLIQGFTATAEAEKNGALFEKVVNSLKRKG